MTVVLVMLYILSGNLVLDQKPMTSMDECYEKGKAIIDEKLVDPRFDMGLFADCVVVKAKFVSSK